MEPKSSAGRNNGGEPTALARALFVGVTYAGHGTRFANLRRHAVEDGRLEPTFAPINGWRAGGFIERLPIPAGARGRIRAIAQSRSFAAFPRPDVIWSSAVETLTPYLWSQLGPLRRPVLLDMDWTVDQGEELARTYFNRPPRTGMRLRTAMWQEHALWRSVHRFLPWSRWAAESLRRHGVDSSRIQVIPPGVDLQTWQPSPRNPSDVLRLLFVGGDFRRKGGDMLLEVLATQTTRRFELDIVTRDDVRSSADVRVHRFEANTPELMELYAKADLFVLPTRAEAFGIATTEALASGLPAIMGNVGGASDIVDQGETGWLIEPTVESLRAALDAAHADRDRLPSMGRRAREVAEARFDGALNDTLVIDLMLEAANSRARQVAAA
jgi:glycosyltransferase involved in cell wall biosynthesis